LKTGSNGSNVGLRVTTTGDVNILGTVDTIGTSAMNIGTVNATSVVVGKAAVPVTLSTYAMPSFSGTAGQVLVTNGVSAASWTTASGVNIFSTSATTLTNISSNENSIFGMITGSNVFAANTLAIGGTYRIRFYGTINNNKTPLTFRIRGTTGGIVGDQWFTRSQAVANGEPYVITWDIIIVSATQGFVSYTYQNAAGVAIPSVSALTNFSTLVSNTMSVTGQYASNPNGFTVSGLYMARIA
jgi:hypothetical protein